MAQAKQVLVFDLDYITFFKQNKPSCALGKVIILVLFLRSHILMTPSMEVETRILLHLSTSIAETPSGWIIKIYFQKIYQYEHH